MKQKALLVTGAPHAGTRLVQKMLGRQPQVSFPEALLNPVGEFQPLHQYFVQVMDRTPLHADTYAFDFDELRFLLDAYLQAADSRPPFVLIKMPYYPLNCLDFFYDYFDELQVVFAQRKTEHIISSFQRRGEDIRYFSNPAEHMRQIKKLPLIQRRYFLAHADAVAIFRAITETTTEKMNQWNQQHPDKEIVKVDTSQLARSPGYFGEILSQLGIHEANLNASYAELNKKRLMNATWQRAKDVFWRNWSVWKEKRRNRGA